MAGQLQIYVRSERALVRLADLLLSPLGWMRPVPRAQVRRILALRLERIGDLVMVLDALRALRAAFPSAAIDLVTGSWNESLAAAIPYVSSTEFLDAPWLSRGPRASGWPEMIRRARGWRGRQYDLVLNFEPDIRTNFLAWLTRAPRRIGFWTGGGGSFLTDALTYDPRAHVSDNALRLVAAAGGGAVSPFTGADDARHPLNLSRSRDEALRALPSRRLGARLIGIHVSGGRAIKQWPLARFRELAERLVARTDATLVFTGTADDREAVAQVISSLPPERVANVSGAMDLAPLAALLGELDLFITGDTGPMHVATAVGTPVVAIFGPSDPVRYGPRGTQDRVVRIDLPCAPCNRIRRPPERCAAADAPDCLAGISVDLVLRAAGEVLEATARDRERGTDAG